MVQVQNAEQTIKHTETVYRLVQEIHTTSKDTQWKGTLTASLMMISVL